MNLFKRILPDIVVIILFAVISFAYFFPAVTEGRILSQHDSVAGIGAGEEAKEYLEQLPEMTAEYEANNKERERLSRQILKSCEVSQYLKLMKAILLEQDRKKKNGKKLNCSDEKNLQRAEKMLISEFAIVFNITVEKARDSVFDAVFEKEKDA